jgi:outer membrane lipoprotein-sorting protein
MKTPLCLTLITAAVAAVACAARAEAPAAPPSAAPSVPAAPAPAAEAPLPPETAEVLDKMDAAGKTVRTVAAKFDYELNQTLYEDIQKRQGRLLYKAPNLLRFEFTDKPVETFTFDGRMVYHKKDATKQLITWELRLPNEPPVETLEIGRTPFPLPFGQRKEAVLRHFTVTRDEALSKADKAGRTVLVLVPRKDTDMARDYAKILLWIDARQQHLPTRARLHDTSENITTVDFKDIEMNKDVPADAFARPAVPEGWEVIAHPKEPATVPAPPTP